METKVLWLRAAGSSEIQMCAKAETIKECLTNLDCYVFLNSLKDLANDSHAAHPKISKQPLELVLLL